MTQNPIASSGTSNVLPTLLAYHEPPLYEDTKQLKFVNCYFLRHYGPVVRSCLLIRRPSQDSTTILVGDASGTILDPSQLGVELLVGEIAPRLLQVMRLIRLTKALFFFADTAEGYRLVDIQLELNQFTGPGTVQEVFAKVVDGPELVTMRYIDEAVHEAILNNSGSFEGDLIIKPARARPIQIGQVYMPLMGQVRR